jgi:hypothetical protein
MFSLVIICNEAGRCAITTLNAKASQLAFQLETIVPFPLKKARFELQNVYLFQQLGNLPAGG